jgi:hypothetical protein
MMVVLFVASESICYLYIEERKQATRVESSIRPLIPIPHPNQHEALFKGARTLFGRRIVEKLHIQDEMRIFD